jgi:hypothetical protein
VGKTGFARVAHTSRFCAAFERSEEQGEAYKIGKLAGNRRVFDNISGSIISCRLSAETIGNSQSRIDMLVPHILLFRWQARYP